MSSRVILRMFLYLGIGCLIVVVALKLSSGWKSPQGYHLAPEELTARPPSPPTGVQPPQPKPQPQPQPALVDIDRRHYPWLTQHDPANLLINRFPPPAGYVVEQPAPGSFGHWLQRLPLKAGRGEVMLHNGRAKSNQDAHLAVLDLDVGAQDLQQCADSLIRLRAEYLWGQGRAGEVHFNTTSGGNLEWTKWAAGYRPEFGSTMTWRRTAAADNSRASFRKYLDKVFTYASTASLVRELAPVASTAEIRAGDAFIVGRGNTRYGHCVIVLNTATNANGRKLFMIAQGFIPAQEMEILINPTYPQSGAWYPADFGQTLQTPEWTFKATDLRRFPDR